MKTKFATATIHIAKYIEVHLTGAVATISQKNQAIVGAVGQAVIQVIDQHFHPVVSVFSFSVFKAKAFRFCHFFCPAEGRKFALTMDRVAQPLHAIPSTGSGLALSGVKNLEKSFNYNTRAPLIIALNEENHGEPSDCRNEKWPILEVCATFE